MIVWGGEWAAGKLGDGGRYNPTTDGWTAVTTSGAPAARQFHAAAWTGSEMTVCGRAGSSDALADTWSYYPYAPSLRIFVPDTNTAIVAWPVWSTAFSLHQRSDLATAPWVPVASRVSESSPERRGGTAIRGLGWKRPRTWWIGK